MSTESWRQRVRFHQGNSPKRAAPKLYKAMSARAWLKKNDPLGNRAQRRKTARAKADALYRGHR